MEKVVWLSRADACALLTAKNLYRHLSDWLPAERAAERLFSLLALEKFRALVRERCFVGGAAEGDHILVQVDPEVYLVLKALGLCGRKDSRGREICITQGGRFRNWKPARYKPYTEALRTMINVFELASAENNLLDEGAAADDIEAAADALFTRTFELGNMRAYFMNPVKQALWDLVSSLDPAGDKHWHNWAASRGASNSIGKLFRALMEWLEDRFRNQIGGFERTYYPDRVNVTRTIAKDLSQAAVNVCFYLQLNPLWRAPERHEEVKALLKGITMPTELSDLKLAFKASGTGLNLRTFNQGNRDDVSVQLITLGRSPERVLEELMHEHSAAQSLSPRGRMTKIDWSVLDNLKGEDAHTSYLCQTLLQQFAVLFTDYAERTLGPLKDRIFSLQDLTGDGDSERKRRRVIKQQVVQSFSFSNALESLLNTINSLSKGSESSLQPFLTQLTELVEQAFSLPQTSKSTLTSFLGSQLSRDEKDKTKSIVTQRLFESVLLSGLFINRLTDLNSLKNFSHGTLDYLPVKWTSDGGAWSLKSTLARLGDTNGHTGLFGIGERWMWSGTSGAVPLQNKLSEAVREASGLGSRGTNLHPVFAPEPILEQFRKAQDCSFGTENSIAKVFSREYISLLRRYFGKDSDFLDRNFQRTSDVKEEVIKTRSRLRDFKINYSKSRPSEELEAKIKLKLKAQSSYREYYINLDPSSEALFILRPFLRWMMCKQLVPEGTSAVVGWLRKRDEASGNALLVEGSLKELPLTFTTTPSRGATG